MAFEWQVRYTFWSMQVEGSGTYPSPLPQSIMFYGLSTQKRILDAKEKNICRRHTKACRFGTKTLQLALPTNHDSSISPVQCAPACSNDELRVPLYRVDSCGLVTLYTVAMWTCGIDMSCHVWVNGSVRVASHHFWAWIIFFSYWILICPGYIILDRGCPSYLQRNMWTLACLGMSPTATHKRVVGAFFYSSLSLTRYSYTWSVKQ